MEQERKYNRDITKKGGIYKQKRNSVENKGGYEEQESNLATYSAIGIAGIGIGVGAKMHKDGTASGFIRNFVFDVANSSIADIGYVKDEVDMALVSQNQLMASIKMAKEGTIPRAFAQAKMQRLQNAKNVLRDLETIKNIRERFAVLNAIQSQEISSEVYEKVVSMTANTLKNTHTLDALAQSEMLRQKGVRMATISDLARANRLSAEDLTVIEMTKRYVPDIMNLKVDSNVFVDGQGKIADTRGFVSALKKISNSIINDFQIPILGINPFKMFHVDDILNTGDYKTPLFSFIKSSEIQPFISYRTDELGTNLIQNGTDIVDLVNGTTIHKNMEQVHVRSKWGTLARRMTGVASPTIKPKNDTVIGRNLAGLAEQLDFGTQPEIYTHNFDILSPGTWIPSLSQKIVETTSPVNVTIKKDSRHAFGKNNTRVFIPGSKSLRKNGIGEFTTQLFAGRDNLDKVTKSTLVPYMLIERVNASLQTFGIGLSSKSLGSASDTFVNLLGKRILPIAVGLGSLKYIDYLLEKKDGTSPKDAVVKTMSVADVNMARLRENSGINDKLERFKELSPGIEFIEELPLVGKIFDSKNEEEAQDYWESGSNAVRKGRFWTLGNTPYTGDRIEYFKPNTKRLVESDWQFTDVKYGSKKEYYDNLWLPTPTSPFAPINHFFTDPYHYEEKHYEDRPYAMTGGINEFREIPLVGGFADATVGRILKPRKKMHEEYWEGERLVNRNDIIQPPFGEVTSPAHDITGDSGENNIPEDKQDEYNEILYTTPSGNANVFAVPKDHTVSELNYILRDSSLKSIGVSGVKTGDVKYGDMVSETMVPLKPNGILNAFEDLWYDATEIGGFYGFTGASVAGEGLVNKPRVQSSNDMNSYSDAFWEKSMGGFGGELSEIFRRFLPNKRYIESQMELNPIRNTMPTWLPGREYFTDFLHGDPYSKIKEGEYRLPGTGYEALHGLSDPTKLKIGSSSLGKDVPDLVKHFLQIDDIEISENESLKDILAKGNEYHANVEKLWENLGVAVASEVYVKDEDMNIEGWIDSILADPTSKTGYAVADIKTINQKGFENAKKGIGKKENIAQIQWYMHQTGQDVGYLHYINRDKPSEDPVTIRYEYDENIVRDSYERLAEARGSINKMLDAKVIQRGDLYKPLDRFRILADVAPYSDNFRYYQDIVGKMPLRPEEKKEVEKISKQVQAVKEKMRLTPYKFKTANLESESVTVKKVLDDGKILTDEYGNNPLKLAGIDFSTGSSTEEGIRNIDYLRRNIRQGDKIKISYDADPSKKINNDTYKTISVIANSNGVNINKDMLKKEYATTKEDDNSPTGIHVKYSNGEILYGKMFENIAHLDTFANTKFLQARSALEMYKRKDLYGKSWQDWKNPVDDFLVPAMENVSSKDVLASTVLGASIGAMFGKKGSTGRVIGAALGGSTMFVKSLYNKLNTAVTQEEYVPERRKKERSMNEYMDNLKYVKNIKLFGEYREKAIQEENVDPLEIINNKKKQGEWKKSQKSRLENIKRQIKAENISLKDAKKQIGNKDAKSFDDINSDINKQLNAIANYREAEAITPLAAQAITYYNESEKTAYGYDQGEPIQNILSALNRTERKYLMPFVEAPEEEREEILNLVPTYMKLALQSTYGMKVDKKTPLDEYFSEHYLPDENWAGWNPDVNLEDVKVKLVKHEGLDASEFDIWNDDKVRSDNLDIPIPKINFEQSITSVRSKLNDMLKNAGLEDIHIDVSLSQSEGVNMNLDISQDRREDIEYYINNNSIF